jgi:adenylate kinase
MVQARLSEPDAAKGFILDGFPRTLPQATELDRMLTELGVTLDAVVEFAVSDEVVVERLLGRGRSDDTEDVIRNRQKVYRDETAPLLDHYRAQLVSVDAVGAVDEVAQRLADALPEK